MEHRNDLYKDWLGAFAAIGSPAVSRDTAARILAVAYVHGNNEAMVYSKKLRLELDHIKQMYHFDGGESPDHDIVVLIKQYVKELEDFHEEHKNDKNDTGVIFHNHAPEWARQMFMERYSVKLIN